MAKYKYKLNELAKKASAEEAEKELGIPKRKFEIGQVSISDDGTSKSTITSINKETGAIGWTIENLPGFDLLYDELEDLVDVAKRVYVKTKEDKKFREFYEQVRKLRNSVRTHLRNEYPDDYKRIVRIAEAKEDKYFSLKKGDKLKVNHPEYKNLILTITNPKGSGYEYISKHDGAEAEKGFAPSGYFSSAILRGDAKLINEAVKIPDPTSFADPDDEEKEQIAKITGPLRDLIKQFKLKKEVSMSGAAGSYLTPYAFRRKGQKADDEAYKQIGYKLVKEKLSIAGKEVEKIDKKGNDPENWVVKYKDGSEESYLKHLNEALNPFDRIDKVLRKAERRAPKFKRGDEVDYLGTKAKVRSSKYNSYDKSFDYTVEYRDENNQRTSADGVKGDDLKTSVRENEIGNKINIARAKSHFKKGEKIAAINKKTKKVTKITGANQFGSFNPKEYDFAYIDENFSAGGRSLGYYEEDDLEPSPKPKKRKSKAVKTGEKMGFDMRGIDEGKSEYTEDEVKYSLGVDDDYKGWVDVAFQKGFKYNEDEDKWYGPVDEVIDLVHVKEPDGSLYGTGSVEKVEKDKTWVRFDGNTIKKFDSDKVVPVQEDKDPGATLGPGPAAGPDGVNDNAYVKQFKYKLVPKNKDGTYVQKGSTLPVRKLWG